MENLKWTTEGGTTITLQMLRDMLCDDPKCLDCVGDVVRLGAMMALANALFGWLP